MYQNRYTSAALPVLRVKFYRTLSGREPVRDWLLDLPKADRQAMGQDIKTDLEMARQRLRDIKE